MKKKSKQLEKLELSIKDIVEGIGNAFSAVWGGIKDLFYQIYNIHLNMEFGLLVP